MITTKLTTAMTIKVTNIINQQLTWDTRQDHLQHTIVHHEAGPEKKSANV